MVFNFGNPAAGASGGAAPGFGAAAPSVDYSNDGRSTPPPLPGGGGSSSFADLPSAAGGGGGSFTFGGSAAAPAAGGPAAGGPAAPTAFAFGGGGGATAPAAPPAASAAPSTATFGGGGGGGFGTSAGAPTAAATMFAPSAPATTAPPLFSSGSAAPAATAPTAAAAPPNPAYIKVPEYNATFPGEVICKRIYQALAKAENGDEWAGQELVQLLKCDSAAGAGGGGGSSSSDGLEASVGNVLLLPLQPAAAAIWKMESANAQVRQQLSTQQVVILHGRDEAMLSHNMLNQVLRIADDLRISEQQALTLYAQATSSHGISSGVDEPGLSMEQRVQKAYFRERRFYLQTVLHLMQHRLRASPSSSGGSDDCSVLQATDQLLANGLVTNLMHLIRNYSIRIVEMMEQLFKIYKLVSNNNTTDSSSTTATMDPQLERQMNVLKIHLQFGMQERQSAAECLFFIAYSTQLEASEVAQLIDLVRDLTNGIAGDEDGGMSLLDPFEDVPDAYENPTPTGRHEWTPSQQHQHQPFHAALPQLREKDPFQWQTELLDAVGKSGQPELLRSVSILTMTIVAAMDTRNTLLDRNTHAYNTFGAGNALLPPVGGSSAGTSTSSTLALVEIHARLDRERVKQDWQRPDVLGILLAAYALLLRSAPSAASPRAAGTTPGGGGGGGGIGAGVATGGFFGGTAAGGSNSGIDVRGAWRMAIAAPLELKSFSFGRQSLIPALQIPSDSSSDCNVSEFLLSVLANLSCHALDILVRYPPISRSKWLQDAEQDLLLRRSNQEQHRQFHSYTGTSGDLETIPSSVNLIERQDCMDDVLAFCVEVSRLDASSARYFWTLQENVESAKMELQLSLAVSQMEKMQTQDDSLRPCYLNMLASLANAGGSDLAVDGASKIHQLLASPNGDIPTQWTEIMETLRWYARELVQGRDSGQSRSSASSQQSTRYYYFDSGMDPVGEATKKSSSSSAGGKSRELGETNTMILQSHLSLIAAVASRSADARAYLRALTLPVQSAEGVIGADAMMMVLFTLAATPISPELRGQVFECLAAILVGCTQEEALTAWQLVESSGIVPIWKLEQYPTDIREGVVPGLSFPPSSTARIVTNRQSQTWIPDDPTFALIYEMEYIEAASGMYPSTEGFLRLLRSLVVAGGCPSTLGDNWRVRAGCSPYMEYVLHLVLPRIVGSFSGLPPLPFRSLEDKNRLLSIALEVVEACITRFVVPMPLASATDEDIQRSFCREKATAERVLGLVSLVDSVVVPTTTTDSKSFIYDFRPMDSSLVPKPSQHHPSGSVPSQRVLASPLPIPKSPGFLVLAEALTSSRGSLFDVLAGTLSNAVASSDGTDADRFALCYALFCATPPTIASTRSRKKMTFSDILVSLQTSTRPSFDNAMKLRHKITTLVLNILCAAASREENFQLALTSSNGPTNIIPVLRFQAKCSTPKAIDLQLSRVGQLLSVRHLVTSVVECIGYDAGIEGTDFSATSVALYFYSQKLDKQNLRADLVSSAFARRIWSLSEQCFGDPRQAQLLRMILDRVLVDLRRGQLSPLLGSTDSPAAGFDAIVGILKSADFFASTSTSGMAASCYEIAHSAMTYSRYMDLLSSLEFWATHFSAAIQLIAQHYNTSGNLVDGNVALSVAWILKGLAGELRSLLSSPIVAHVLPSTRPMKYKRTLALLFDENSFVNLVHCIPVDQPVYAAALSEALHLVLGGALLSCAALGDAIETSQIVTALVDKLSVKVHPETARNLALCIYLATIHTPMAGEGMGRLAVVLANAVGNGGVAAGILSSALEISLGRWSPAGVIPDQTPFLRAATVLSRLSCQVSDRFPIIADSDTIMARSCLQVLLMTVLDDKSAHHLLTDPGDFRHASPVINTFVNYLSKLDSNVPFLLHAIALLQFGTDLLCEADVFGALTAAAEGYTRHESQIEYSTFPSAKTTIGPPPFWSGHLKLMSLMIAGASDHRKTEIAGRVINILSRYEVVSSRLISRFPSDGEDALAFFRCCALAYGAMDGKQSSTALLSVPPVTGYRTISVLTMHIAENPLPAVLQTPLPAHLMSKKAWVDSDVVAVCQDDSTWWDKLDFGGTMSPKLLQVYQYGIVGCQLVKAGLCVIRSSPGFSKIDSRTLSHAICKCADAVRFIDSQSYHQQSPFIAESNGTETALEAQKLRGELLGVVSDLLRVTLMCVRQRNWIAEWEGSRELITFALDHTQLDSQGLTLEFAAGDENRPDYVKEAAMALRNSLA